MIELIFIMTPVVASALTDFIKKTIPVFDTMEKSKRVIFIRITLALMSFGTIVGTYALTGSIDTEGIEIVMTSLSTAVFAHIGYKIK